MQTSHIVMQKGKIAGTIPNHPMPYSISNIKETCLIGGVYMENRSHNNYSRILSGRSAYRLMRHISRTAAILLIIAWARSPAVVQAETISLAELLPEIGLQALAPELNHIQKGGSMTASLDNPSKLDALGFVKLKRFDRMRLQNLGEQFWLITNPATGQTAKIKISRQNKPAVKPRIRVKLISLSHGPQGKKAK